MGRWMGLEPNMGSWLKLPWQMDNIHVTPSWGELQGIRRKGAMELAVGRKWSQHSVWVKHAFHLTWKGVVGKKCRNPKGVLIRQQLALTEDFGRTVETGGEPGKLSLLNIQGTKCSWCFWVGRSVAKCMANGGLLGCCWSLVWLCVFL